MKGWINRISAKQKYLSWIREVLRNPRNQAPIYPSA
jgi:hypothetical protein